MPILVRILLKVLHMLENQNFFFTFSNSIVTLQCSFFLISVKCVICFQYFGQHIEIFWKKVYFFNFFYLLGIDTDPDRYDLDADPDLEPAKLCGSDPTRVRIHNH
jgi:hypothetical protein